MNSCLISSSQLAKETQLVTTPFLHLQLIHSCMLLILLQYFSITSERTPQKLHDKLAAANAPSPPSASKQGRNKNGTRRLNHFKTREKEKQLSRRGSEAGHTRPSLLKVFPLSRSKKRWGNNRKRKEEKLRLLY